jgi:hypothetical protein
MSTKENGTNYGLYFVDDLNAAIGKNIPKKLI